MPHLGPLELVGHRWVIGDPKRMDGSCVVLTVDGMEPHKHGAPVTQEAVPWGRVIDLRLQVAPRARHATRAWGLLGSIAGSGWYMDTGPSGCSVSGSLRNPYSERWSVKYTHHERGYPYGQASLVKTLFDKISEAKVLHRLGDREWLYEAVSRVNSVNPNWNPRVNRQIAEIVADLGG